MGMRVVLATRNRGKIEEIADILEGAGVEALTLDSFEPFPEPAEDGDSFEENAIIKARATRQATGLPALADDSGLEVDALGGAPGIFSARYGGEGLSDMDRCLYLLERMDGIEPRRRTARFRCSMVLYPSPFDPSRALVTEGVLEGLITAEPAGESGFGYDPVFYIPSRNATAAQIDRAEKNTISHRYRALVEMKALLTGQTRAEWSGDREG